MQIFILLLNIIMIQIAHITTSETRRNWTPTNFTISGQPVISWFSRNRFDTISHYSQMICQHQVEVILLLMGPRFFELSYTGTI